MATSDDLRGLVLHGHSEEELLGRIPDLIKDLLEMDGSRVAEVTAVQDHDSPEGFELPDVIAKASLAMATA